MYKYNCNSLNTKLRGEKFINYFQIMLLFPVNHFLKIIYQALQLFRAVFTFWTAPVQLCFTVILPPARGAPSYTLHLLSVLTVCVLPRHWGRLAGLGTGIQSWASPKLITASPPPTAPAMYPHRFHSCWIMVPVWPGGTQTHLSSYADKLILLPK